MRHAARPLGRPLALAAASPVRLQPIPPVKHAHIPLQMPLFGAGKIIANYFEQRADIPLVFLISPTASQAFCCGDHSGSPSACTDGAVPTLS